MPSSAIVLAAPQSLPPAWRRLSSGSGAPFYGPLALQLLRSPAPLRTAFPAAREAEGSGRTPWRAAGIGPRGKCSRCLRAPCPHLHCFEKSTSLGGGHLHPDFQRWGSPEPRDPGSGPEAGGLPWAVPSKVIRPDAHVFDLVGPVTPSFLPVLPFGTGTSILCPPLHSGQLHSWQGAASVRRPWGLPDPRLRGDF